MSCKDDGMCKTAAVCFLNGCQAEATTASATGEPLLELVWRINDAVLKVLPRHMDAGVMQARNTKSPAEVLVNVESLIRYYKEASSRAPAPSTTASAGPTSNWVPRSTEPRPATVTVTDGAGRIILTGALDSSNSTELVRLFRESATAASAYGYAVEQSDGHITFFKEDPVGFRQKKWEEVGTVVHALYLGSAPAPSDTASASETQQREDTTAGASETMPVQDVWLAAGGNPGINASKQDVLDALKLMDAAVDECDKKHSKTAAQPTNSTE